MKKIIVFLFLLLMPVFVSASIDQNLYYGLRNNGEVRELQEYLSSEGFYSGRATGNFFSLTLSAVKKYQKSIGLKGTGYVGRLTRQIINSDLLPEKEITKTTTQAQLTGSLDLSKSASYQDQSTIAPQLKFKLSDFSLINNTTEAINLKTIEVGLAVGQDLYVANLYISNLYVIYGDNPPAQAGKTTTQSNTAYKNLWQVNFQIAPGQAIGLAVYGDINSSIPLNSTVNSSLLATGITAVSNTQISTNSNVALPGQNIAFGEGSLTVSRDNSGVMPKITAINQRVAVGKFQFTATNESYVITELKFVVPNSNTISTISGAFLSDATAPPTYNGKDHIFDFNVNIPVLANSSKSIDVHYDFNNNIFLNSTSTNVAPVLVYVKAKNSRGEFIDGLSADYSNNVSSYYGGIALLAAGIKPDNIYFFKSTPIFTADTVSSSVQNGSNADIYTFNITADSNGDVSIKQIIFAITISGPNNTYPHLNSFALFKGNTDYTNQVAIAKTVNSNYIGLTADNGIGIGNNIVIVTFNREETIPAGKIQTYVLKAKANNFVASLKLGSDSVSTYIPADADPSNARYLRMAFTKVYGLTQSANSMSVRADYNLLWSDKSAPSHSDLNGSSTYDWYNGFGVLNLPLSTQTITAK